MLLPPALRELTDHTAFLRWFGPRFVDQAMHAVASAVRSGSEASATQAAAPLLVQQAPLLFDDALSADVAAGRLRASAARVRAALPHFERDWARLCAFKRSAHPDALAVVVRSNARYFACWIAKPDANNLVLLVANTANAAAQRRSWRQGVAALLANLRD